MRSTVLLFLLLLTIRPAAGFELTDPAGRVWATVLHVGADLRDGPSLRSDQPRYSLQSAALPQGGQRRHFRDAQGQLDFECITVPAGDRALRLRLAVQNVGASPLHLERLTVISLRLAAPDGIGQVLPNAYQVGYLRDGERIYTPTIGQRYEASYWSVALERPALVTGFITGRHNLSRFSLQPTTSSVELTVTADCDGALLAPGASRVSDELFLSTAPDTFAELERLGALMGEASGARVRPDNFAIWCSWYTRWIGRKRNRYLESWRGGLEAGVEPQIALIGERFASRGAAWMRVVDDAAEMSLGDWEDRTPHVPRGFDRLTGIMHTHGVRSGFWLVPLLASVESRLYREHPEWFATQADGTTFTMRFYDNTVGVLDSSQPAVCEHLRALGRRLRTRGFDYVMTDFLERQLDAPRFADPMLTKFEVHRRALEALREGLGDDVYWLGCTALPGPCMGLVDGYRVSGDSFGGFGREAYAYAQSGMRWFYHRQLWANDPDSIITRGHWDFAKREYVREDKGIDFNQGWMSWIALSGAAMTYGDTFDDLPPHSLALYQRIFPPLPLRGRPLDLWENAPHHVWGAAAGSGTSRRLLFGAFNYFEPAPVRLRLNLDAVRSRINAGDPAAPITHPPAGYLVWDFWNQCLLPTQGSALTLTIAPQRSCLLSLHERLGHPQLLATSGHFSQGALETSDLAWHATTTPGRGELTLRVRGNGGDPTTLFVHVPPGWMLHDATLDGRPIEPRRQGEQILALDVSALASPAALRLKFKGAAAPTPPLPIAPVPRVVLERTVLAAARD